MYYGDICHNIMHSLLTRGVRDYKLFITIIASKQFGGFLSLFFFFFSFFSDEQVFTKDTIVTGTFSWSSMTEQREKTLCSVGGSVEIICLNLCIFHGERKKSKSCFLGQQQEILWYFILTGCSFHEYQGLNSVVSVQIKIHCNRHHVEWN